MAVKCPKCQSDNTDTARFCSNCATALTPAGQPPALTKTLESPVYTLTKGNLVAGKYRITEEIGRGGMGVVYEAEDIRLKRTVALKFLPMELTHDAQARERFIHEAQAASALDHPHICTIYEIGETDRGQMYIAMAFYRGESLKDKIKRGPLGVKDTIAFSVQVAEGLAKAHEQGIVHRDIKPANILVTEDGTAKIVDFGLAKLAGEARLTLPGTVLGTVAYMSPEQVKGDTVDARSDVWSLGVVLYEMITGTLPFDGKTEQSFVYSILHRDPKPVKDLPAGVPLEYGEIVRKALAKNPERRFCSGKEMAEALHDLEHRMAAESYAKTRKLVFRRPRKRLLIGSGIAAVLIAAALIIWTSLRPGLAFENRDKLLVADVENQTGDQVFDLALKTAIEADLQQSTYANVYDKSQVADTLRLMRMEPSSRINEQVGLEICRFAGVRALILPRILSVGEAFELQAIVVDPVKKRYVDRIRFTARGREQVLLEAIDNLARRLRSRLGESLKSIEKTDKPIAKVTTSSWEALNYFSMGVAKRNEGKTKEAVAFFEMALEKDPHFVMARGSLGLLLIQFLHQEDKGKDALRQALKDAEAQNAPQNELLRMKAINLQFVDKDLPGALEKYRLIRELYPDNMAAYNNSGRILQQLGRLRDAAEMYEQAHKIDPRSTTPLWNLWWLCLGGLKDPAKAEQASRVLVSLMPENAFAMHTLAWSLVAERRFAEAEDGMRATLKLDPSNQYALPNLAHLLYRRGAPKEAVAIYQGIIKQAKEGRLETGVEHVELSLGLALVAAGETAEARRTLVEAADRIRARTRNKPLPPQDEAMAATMLAGAGRKDEARALAESAGRRADSTIDVNYELARTWAVMGDRARAIRYLEAAFAAGYDDPYLIVIDPPLASLQDDPAIEKLAPRRAEAGH